MKKKLIAALLSAAMVVSAVPVFASDAAADEETATESSTESPLAGKKIAYIMYMSSATIFQKWSDSFTATAEKLGMKQVLSSATIMQIHGRVQLNSARRVVMMD